MKKLVLIIFAFALPLFLYAQKEVGTTIIYPRLGLNWSKFTNDGIRGLQEGEYYDSKYRRDSRAELKFSISSVMLLQEALVLSTVGRALTMMTCRMQSFP